MDLEFQDPSEVWWEYRRRSNPDSWARKAIPAESALYIFADRRSQAAKRPKKTPKRAER
jgi:hypothetical protein